MKAFSNDNYSFPTQNTCIIRMAHRLIQSYLSLFLAGLVMTPLATASDAKVTKITWQNLESSINSAARTLNLSSDTELSIKAWNRKSEKFRSQSLPLIENEEQGVAMFNAWLKEAGLGGQALITANSPQGAWLNLQPKSAFSLLLSYGIGTKRLGSKIYVDQVLEQSAASRAGIKRGDRLVSDQALLATECTLSRCKLALQKSPNASIQNLSLKAEPKSLGELLYGDAEKSDRIYAVPTELSHQTLKIGYTRLLGTDFPHRNELLQSIGRRMQDQADIWLLDLRGGIPSGSEDLSRWFFYQEKDGKKSDPIFSKPLAIIVDDSTAGDRERLALVVQQQNRGVIIGTRSMGRPWPVTVRQIDQSPFWLAWPEELQTQDLSLLPDYELKAELAYAGGHDAILERSLLILAQLEISRDKSAKEKPAKLPAKKQQ